MTWIVDAKFDKRWFIYPFLLSPLAFGFWYLLKSGMGEMRATEILFLIFMGFFDQPHIARTFARTHEDKREFQRNKLMHLGLIPLLLLIAVTAMSFNKLPLLLLFVAFMGQWHIFKQNFGLLRIYPRGDAPKEIIEKNRKIEWWFFHLMFLNSLSPYLGRADVTGMNRPLVGPMWEALVFSLFVLVSIYWLLNYLKEFRSSKTKPYGRIYFLSGVWITHLFIFGLAHFLPIPVMLVLETIYHDVQYHGWMNLYERRVLKHAESKITKWVVFAFAYGMLTLVIDDQLGQAAFIINMVVLYHYIAEGFIWRFRSSPELAPMLVNR